MARRGIAAHLAYNEGEVAPTSDHRWINGLVEIFDHAGSAEAVLEHGKMA